MRKKKEVVLSSFLKEQVMLNQKEVNLSGKGITQVDEISPFLCSQIQSLNLSNNKLVSISNLSQFSQLVQLDISSNKVGSCQELECLRNMVKLKKVYFSNNPFLSEPIEENLLELILQKQTDIEILSLQLIKEVENEEIKIIFLKNYLSKIELHQELKRKANIETKTNRLRGEQLIQKIIPQFYAAIQSPKLLSSIKKQALTLKRQCRDSLEDALSKAKEIKSQKIDQLLKSIVDVIQDSRAFFEERSFTLQVNLNENTITFSPQKKARKQFDNTVRIEEEEQYSPVRFIEFSKDQNTFEDITMTNLKPHPQERSPQIAKLQQETNLHNLDVLETTRKQNSGFRRTPGRFSSFAEFKESLQNKKKLSQNKPISIRTEQRETGSKLRTPITQHKPVERSTQYIRVMDSTQSEVFNSNKNSLHKPPSTNSPRNVNESTVSWRNIYQNIQELTPENIEIVYYKTLTKLHPMFYLLHSPASSLNDQEKNTLIETLKTHHKETFCELLKEKASNQTLLGEREQARAQTANLYGQSQNIFRQNNQLKQEYSWIENRFKCLQSDYAQLLVKYKELQNAEKTKSTTISNIQTSYKKIKACYTQKAEELMRLQKYDQNEQKLRVINQKSITRRYLAQLSSKATLWKKVLERENKMKIKRQRQLYFWGIFSFKQNRLLQLTIKEKIKKYHHKILKEQFYEWKKDTVFEKKSKKLSLIMNNKISNELLDLLKKNIPESRMAKFAKIQAFRFYSEHKYKVYFSLWQDLHKRRANLNIEASKLWSLTTCSKHFFALKNLIEQRRSRMSELEERLVGNSISRQFKKLVYLMRKEMIEMRESEIKVRVQHEHCMRASSFDKIKNTINQKILLKAKKALLLKHVLSQKMKTLKRQHYKSQKMAKKFRNYCYFMRSKIIKRCLLRQNSSFLYADQLLSKAKMTFVRHLLENKEKRSTITQRTQRLLEIREKQLKFLKLKLMKGLYVLRLKGRNYVKKRAIQEMNFQMDINDQKALELIKLGQESIVKCQQEIIFLKRQIQTQSNRQMALLAQNETLMLTFNESCEIMKELRKQVDLIREESLSQQIRYNKLAKKYNEAVQILQRRQKKERLQQITQGQQPS